MGKRKEYSGASVCFNEKFYVNIVFCIFPIFGNILKKEKRRKKKGLNKTIS